MNKTLQQQALNCAVKAAHSAGNLMRANFNSTTKKVNESTQHDIKLELDVRCQKVIERTLRQKFPSIAILGEEGTVGDPQSDYRWVVDPIDGTVNFTYNIPHCCVSIALQMRIGKHARHPDLNYKTICGVVYDPFCDELWTAMDGTPAYLNGKSIRVSNRRQLKEAIVSLGFAKFAITMQIMLPLFNRLVPRVRKVRLMGAAALSMVYVASGRFDAYTEAGVRLWDIAAGGLIIECAGGEFHRETLEDTHTYRVMANNGHLRRAIEKLAD